MNWLVEGCCWGLRIRQQKAASRSSHGESRSSVHSSGGVAKGVLLVGSAVTHAARRLPG